MWRLDHPQVLLLLLIDGRPAPARRELEAVKIGVVAERTHDNEFFRLVGRRERRVDRAIVSRVRRTGEVELVGGRLAARHVERQVASAQLVVGLFGAADGRGKVVAHRDYWDAAEELYAKLPLLGPLVRLLGRRFAAPG